MNSLSWMLWFADTLPSLSKAGAVIAGLILLISFAILVFTSFIKSIDSKEETQQDCERAAKVLKPFLRWSLIVWVFAMVIPSQKTIYLIMGSEIGEEVVTSELGNKVLTAVEKKVDEYLRDDE